MTGKKKTYKLKRKSLKKAGGIYDNTFSLNQEKINNALNYVPPPNNRPPPPAPPKLSKTLNDKLAKCEAELNKERNRRMELQNKINELEMILSSLQEKLKLVSSEKDTNVRSLDDIENELRIATQKCYAGEERSEDYLERLDNALRSHPEYAIREQKIRSKWDYEQKEENEKALKIMKKIVPPNIRYSTEEKIEEDIREKVRNEMSITSGDIKRLAKRIYRNKALHIVHYPKNMISKFYVNDLVNKFDIGNSLDLTELRAVYASLPTQFDNDNNGQKAEWKERIRSQLVNLVRNNESNNIIPNKKRNSVYKNVPLNGFFQIENEENWSPDAADPYAPSNMDY